MYVMYAFLAEMRCFISLITILSQSASELAIVPRDTESYVGDTTYLNCSTNITSHEIFWYHGDKYIYIGDMILDPYRGRFTIDRTASVGSHNLVIHSVEPRDAGKYLCVDDDGFGTKRSAELVVLDKDPVCQSNSKPDGVIGQNIFNIPLDEIQLTCIVTYHGNIPPQMEWKKVGDNAPIKDYATSNVTSGNRLTHTLKLKGDISLDKSSYVCQTKRSTQCHNHHNCTPEIIKVLYFVGVNVTEQHVNIGEKITCIAKNNTFSCINQWYHGNNSCPVSCDESISTHLPGEYLCTVKCNIRSKEYVTNVTKVIVVVEASTPLPLSTPAVVAAAVLLPIASMGLLCLLISFVVLRRKNKTYKGKLKGLQHINESLATRALLETAEAEGANAVSYTREGDATYVTCTYINKISTTAAKESGSTITGIALLEKELFATSENSSQIDVFETDTNEFKHSRTLTLGERREQLHNPVDIASCHKSQRLYIVDWDKKKPANKVHRIDRNGVLSNYWNTEKFRGTIFVTNDDRIIISFNRKNYFKIYTYKGEWIKTVFTNSANCRILHSIQLKCGQFVVSVKDERDCRILFLNDDSTVLQKFSGQGEDGKRSRYVYFALRGDDNVIVLDFKKKLIFSLDPTCAVNLQLLSERNGIKSPSRVCFDTSRNLLLIVDNKADYSGEISIYKVDP